MIDEIPQHSIVYFSTHKFMPLTHWGRVTHICVNKSTIICSDNGLSPGRCQAIISTNASLLLIRPLGTNFNEMLIEILTFSFMKMRLKVSSAKWRPFCLGLNVLTSVYSRRWHHHITAKIVAQQHIARWLTYGRKTRTISLITRTKWLKPAPSSVTL